MPRAAPEQLARMTRHSEPVGVRLCLTLQPLQSTGSSRADGSHSVSPEPDPCLLCALSWLQTTERRTAGGPDTPREKSRDAKKSEGSEYPSTLMAQ